MWPFRASEMTARVIPDLIDIEQELFELPQKVCPGCCTYMGTAS